MIKTTACSYNETLRNPVAKARKAIDIMINHHNETISNHQHYSKTKNKKDNFFYCTLKMKKNSTDSDVCDSKLESLNYSSNCGVSLVIYNIGCNGMSSLCD